MTDVNSPITIGPITIKNRLTQAPTVKFDYTDASATVTEKHIKHYRDRAAGGAGLICVEATAVLPGGRFSLNHMGLWDDSFIPGHAEIAKAVHDEGAKVIIQINHTGGITNPNIGRPIAPSEVPARHGMSSPMTRDEIIETEDAFVAAAVRAKKAGYDGVQLHGCHTYLINQFQSPITNKREDEFGGSVENRARFGSDIIRKIREACGPDFLISVRISGWDPDTEDAIAIGEEYVKAGCEYLQVSDGIAPKDGLEHDETLPYNNVVELGVRFHEHFKGRVPVSVVNGIIDPAQIKYLLDNDLTDTVDLGRAVLADPNFCNAVIKGEEFQKCFSCKACQYGPRTEHKCPAAIKRGEIEK